MGTHSEEHITPVKKELLGTRQFVLQSSLSYFERLGVAAFYKGIQTAQQEIHTIDDAKISQ